MSARALMMLGTSSHVGKSLLTTALCRIFADQGVRVAPFKAQNMSLNSAATADGLEIGRAQALQAEAARIPASVHMNPILLKPAGDMTSQIVVRGEIWARLSAAEYHQRRIEELLPIVQESYETLASQYEVIVLEGAGSPAEINLKQHDIVNMRMADMADARCLLIGDIDRGGVFASLYGTVHLLEPAEQDRIAGFIINKFRGDQALLQPGVRTMEERLAKRCIGVVPWLHGLALEEEDSLGLTSEQAPVWQQSSFIERSLRIAVIALPSFSNFTDFDALRQEPSVDLRFCREPAQLTHADILIVPGSKQTMDDLLWIRKQSIDTSIRSHARDGLVAGLCGGMQMLGLSIRDDHGVEREGEIEGLGLLPFRTRMHRRKVTRQTNGRLIARTLFGQAIAPTDVRGYEIHVGDTAYEDGAQPFCLLQSGEPDGCVTVDTRIFGTYLHGIFDEDGFRHAFLAAARSFRSLAPVDRFENWKQKREASFSRLADATQKSLDMATIFRMVGQSYSHQYPRAIQDCTR